MADDQAKDAKPNPDWPDIHSEALLEYERAWQREQGNIEEAYEDLRFRRGKLQDQWTPEALLARTGRPCHVVNVLPQFIRQVTGDMRKSRPGIKVVPVDGGADLETADVRGGIIRYIENRSKAKHIYTAAADQQVTAGIGHWQIETEYQSPATFNQEIRISPIDDGIAVLWDADANLPDRSDANHCFVPHDQTTASFKRQWPDNAADGFNVSLCGSGTTGAFDNWHTDDYIRTVIYWKKKPSKRTLALMPDGTIEDLTEVTEGQPKEEVEHSLQWLRDNKGARIEERDSYKLCRYILSMKEVLEERDWPGMHIPVVPAIGEEVKIGRDIYRHGIVRYARDLQRMTNYYASAETEVIALQPKAPWLGTKKMFEAQYDQWENANTENLPFLEYTPDPSAPQSMPTRVQPMVRSEAVQGAMVNADANLKRVIGIYDAGLGAKSNETSGIAIQRRDEQSDTGTYIYLDNLALAVARTGEIINDLIPHIYDTQRQLHILGQDQKSAVVTINKPTMQNGQQSVENDMTVGAYDIMMEEGPSYTTRREQMRDGMTEFIRAFPPAATVVGDLFAKAQDWPHAEEIGERLQELLPPPVKAKLEAEQQQREQASGKPPPPPSPQQQAQAQAEAQQKAMQQQEIALKMAEQKAKTDEMEAKARKANAEADRAEVEAQFMKQRLAAGHMDELRSILTHQHDIEGKVQGRAHAQDRHSVDMTTQGMNAAQGAERHAQAMQPEPETTVQ